MLADPRLLPKMLWISAEERPTHSGWIVEQARSGAEAVAFLCTSAFDVVVIEASGADSESSEEGIAREAITELMEECRRAQPDALFTILDRQANASDAARYVRLGAHDVTNEPADAERMIEAAAAFCASHFPAREPQEPWRKILVGASRAMLRTADIIRLVGSRRSTVLITGETGTGKEMVARALHMASPRAHLPLVSVNCSALPENLLEAELFGHVKGAFTGAIQNRMGRFEQAHRGTLFLDEIGDLPLDIQTKLLRVLQEREFQRVGSSETVRVDVRLIAATHVNLPERVREGRFREDLYYRLNVVPISTPPLRERLEDIPALVQHFLEKVCRQEEIPLRRVAPETLARLGSYSWPGNVRQLENGIEMAVVMSGEREMLYPSDFALPAATPRPIPAAAAPIAVPDTGLDFERTVGDIERQIIQQALRKANGNKTAAAEMLRLKRTTLSAKLRSLDAIAGR